MKPRLPCSQPPGPSSLLLKITPPQQNSAETSNHQIKLPLNRAMHLFQLSTDSIHRRQFAIKIRTTHTINQSSQREYKYVDTKSTRQIKFEKQKHTNKKCTMRENTVKRIKSTAGLGGKKIRVAAGTNTENIRRLFVSHQNSHTHTERCWCVFNLPQKRSRKGEPTKFPDVTSVYALRFIHCEHVRAMLACVPVHATIIFFLNCFYFLNNIINKFYDPIPTCVLVCSVCNS